MIIVELIFLIFLLHNSDKFSYDETSFFLFKEKTMTTITDPVIDSWYKDVENDLSFKVVAFDEGEDSIEVQYLNGDIGDYDIDTWYNSTFDFIEAPEDWSAPFGVVEADDLGYSDPDSHNKPDQDNMNISDILDK